jgi:hypothetical protein
MRSWVRAVILGAGVMPIGAGAGPDLAIDDPILLQALERRGFALAPLAFDSAAPDNGALATVPRYRTIVDTLTADLQAARRRDPSLGTTMRASHRLFDARWLASPRAHFELVGVVNRLDRAAFAPGTCGELRFIYRLAYRQGEVYSRLPMTVNLVFFQKPAPDCRAVARRWQELGTALERAGAEAFDPGKAELKSIEVNLQSVRWPSTVRPDMAGYAEYVLRVFRPLNGQIVVAALENTPDVARLLASPAQKGKLLAWLRDPANFRAIDEGHARVPDEFLATQVTSVALHGVHRLANMPFSALFREQDFADLPFATGRHVRSPHGMLRRLNDLSCSGCHQGRTVAGFHFVGVDREGTAAVNAIAVGASPHFLLDQPRRAAHLAAVASGGAGDAARPLSVRAIEEDGALGAHCGLGDPSFSAWGCAPGLRCEAVVRDTRVSATGVCLPATPAPGSACMAATAMHNLDPHRDRLRAAPATSCGIDAICEESSVGFPGGMCARPGCENLRAGETCGSIAILQGFNNCLAGNRPFAQCLSDNVRPATLQACDAATPCRDDYICSRTASGTGACIPPYFLFQLRLDGHPAPS